MTTYSLTTRAAKGSALTHTEMDANLNAMLRKIGDNATLRAASPENGVQVWQECYATAGDGGHGVFRGVTGAAAATYTHNGGTIVVPSGGDGSAAWLREYSGAVNVKWFGAKGDWSGDGTGTDDAVALQAAIDVGDSTYWPEGKYLTSVKLDFDSGTGVFHYGDGGIAVSTGFYAKTVLVKKSTLTGLAWDITSDGTKISNIMFVGEAGNGASANGDSGVRIWANTCCLEDVSVYGMGSTGIRIGHDTLSNNSNNWRLSRVITKDNVGDGIYISYLTSPTGPDANAGMASDVIARDNGGDGIKVGNADLNTFINCLCEGNTGIGLRVSGSASWTWIIGGDREANTGGQLVIDSGAAYTGIIGVNSTEISDSGTGTYYYTGVLGLSSASTGALITNGDGPAFSGNSAYMALGADANERIRVGWQQTALGTGLVPAQILAQTSTLVVASRDTAGATINLHAGTGIPLVAKVKVDSLELQTGMRLDLQNSQGTVGAAGGASALPATPTGYIPIKVGGTEYVLPYYAKT